MDSAADDARKSAPEQEEERKLVWQEYMLDTSLSVGAVLQQNGIVVHDFVRLECGAPDAPFCAEDVGATVQAAAAARASAV